jgi:hypothetical protein
MSELKLTGRVLAIMDKQQVNDKFAKREFVIETDEKYPQQVKFELTQDYCDLIDTYKIGQSINVSFNIRGRAWTNKQGKDVYFVSLNAWRLESAGEERPSTYGAETAAANPPTDDAFTDLPF